MIYVTVVSFMYFKVTPTTNYNRNLNNGLACRLFTTGLYEIVVANVLRFLLIHLAPGKNTSKRKLLECSMCYS